MAIRCFSLHLQMLLLRMIRWWARNGRQIAPHTIIPKTITAKNGKTNCQATSNLKLCRLRGASTGGVRCQSRVLYAFRYINWRAEFNLDAQRVLDALAPFNNIVVWLWDFGLSIGLNQPIINLRPTFGLIQSSDSKCN